MPQAKMSTINDGYDTEAMAQIEANIKSEVEMMKKVCFKQIENRLAEKAEETDERIDGLEAKYKSQITETQAAISAI